jgi:hypothetical protein
LLFTGFHKLFNAIAELVPESPGFFLQPLFHLTPSFSKSSTKKIGLTFHPLSALLLKHTFTKKTNSQKLSIRLDQS